MSRAVARKMAAAIRKADSESIAGDCTLANGGIVLETGTAPVHPMQQLARAYGIDEEPVAVAQRAQTEAAARREPQAGDPSVKKAADELAAAQARRAPTPESEEEPL